MGITERCNRKSNALKLYIKMLQLKKAILNHFFSLKGEADVPTTRKYQKVLAHVKCGMRWGALAMRIQTSMVGKQFKRFKPLK